MDALLRHSCFAVRQYREARWLSIDETVSEEVPLDISWILAGQIMGQCRLWAWPHTLAELALGHVLLDCSGSAAALQEYSGAVKLVDAQSPVPHFQVLLERKDTPLSVLPPPQWGADKLLQAMDAFIAADGLWDATGCFHRMGVYSVAEGRLLYRAEDIGRHNCVDRVAGWAASHGVSLQGTVLLASARLTSSLCAKALRAGFRFLVSRSAVTTAALAMAEQKQATLVGFARSKEQRFTVFCDPRSYLAE